MSKILKIAFWTMAIMVGLLSCSKNKTYSDYLKEEREHIKKYINANQIDVQMTQPEGDGEWKTADGRNIYFQSASGLYYHQIDKGTGEQTPKVRSTVYVRYKGVTLSGDLLFNTMDEQAPNPDRFIITSNASASKFGVGFQEAVKNLTTGGRCKVIIPFNIGNGLNQSLNGTNISDAANYTPMVYEIVLEKIQ
jgi:FKBP-type peptidyl-prolyl cis-trans isomerase